MNMRIQSPVRASHSYIQRLFAGPGAVFPLLCPVREAEWIADWHPELVVSATGVAEPDCVFVTSDDRHRAVWYITRYEPENGYVEMLKITPGVTAARITIQLAPVGNYTEASVTYTHTSLGPEGDAFVASFTEDHYERFMKAWESRLNHYLQTGAMLAEN